MCLPFLISWTLTHCLMTGFGCLAPNSTFFSAAPLTWEVTSKGLAFMALPKWAFLYCLSRFCLIGDYRASWQYKDQDTCPNCWHHYLWIIKLSKSSHTALVVKNMPADAGDIRDAGSIPGSGRSPGGEHGNPLQYSCLENPMDRGAWLATVHGVTESDTTKAT